MFTVIIPLFNKASYIEKAIRSVLAQTFVDFDIIIVDDGSTDNGIDRIAHFNDSRLTLIRQSNSGVSAARNKGVSQASNEYIAFLDADDWWESTFLSDMHQLITNYPDAALYGSNYYVVKNEVNTPAKVGLEDNFSAGYIDYFKVYSQTFWVPINCSFVIVRKAAFIAIGGFRPLLKFGEDLDLWIRLALHYKVAYLNSYLAYSNQDVVIADRALGPGKIWKKDEHVLFNTEHLADEEKKYPQLKYLLDRLRLSALVDYHLNNHYTNELRTILGTIDFSKHPSSYRYVYNWPRFIISSYFQLKKIGSFAKQTLIKRYSKLSLHKTHLF